MHAEIHELIALRDGEPVDAVTANHVRDCEDCKRRVVGLSQARDALRQAPLFVPPPGTWAQVAAQRELEIGGDRARPWRLRAVAAMAVVAIGTVLTGLLPQIRNMARPAMESGGASDVGELRQRSRELEYLLQRYEQPGVMSLRLAGAISELEDSIALIDYQLNAVDTADDDHHRYELWQQRVALMETLVTVRVAESYSDAI